MTRVLLPLLLAVSVVGGAAMLVVTAMDRARVALHVAGL